MKFEPIPDSETRALRSDEVWFEGAVMKQIHKEEKERQATMQDIQNKMDEMLEHHMQKHYFIKFICSETTHDYRTSIVQASNPVLAWEEVEKSALVTNPRLLDIRLVP